MAPLKSHSLLLLVRAIALNDEKFMETSVGVGKMNQSVDSIAKLFMKNNQGIVLAFHCVTLTEGVPKV